MSDKPPMNLLNRVSSHLKNGQVEEGLVLLRGVLRDGRLSAEELDRAGRLVRRALASVNSPVRPLRVALLGQFTTSWLATALAAAAWARDVAIEVTEGGYDTVIQDLSRLSTAADQPDLIVLLPWNQRLFGGSPSERVGDELRLWIQAWQMVNENLGARLLQVGYDWIVPGALGAHLDGASGRIHAVRALNQEIRAHLPAGSYFLDMEQVSGTMGRDSFYDMRRYYWTKQPFSEDGTQRLAAAIFAGIRALTTGPKKVVVLDLDNTLWGGVVGETGPLGVALGDSPEGEGFRAFQSLLKDLAKRGIILAVASKNNPGDAREVFEKNHDMILRFDDFAAFEACWDPKFKSIARIATTLNLGLDSFVFFDDNPAERDLIRQALPEVEVVEVPEDPAEYARALLAGGWFETTALTHDDEARATQYAVERQRRELEQSSLSIDDYLRSLAMVADVRAIDEADLMRVVQLLAKTNQFNLTTRRHTRENVLGLIATPGSIAITLRIVDRFGDHGLIAVLIGVPAEEPATIHIDTWLMSCRVIGRTVEQFFLGVFLERSRELGYRRIIGEYLPTKKNGLVSELYDTLGFHRQAGPAEGAVLYELDVERAAAPACFITWRQVTGEGRELAATPSNGTGKGPSSRPLRDTPADLVPASQPTRE